jgi:hypothetical protein
MTASSQAWVVALAILAAVFAAAQISSGAERARKRSLGTQRQSTQRSSTRPPSPQSFAHLLGPALATAPTPFVPVATWRGRTVAWISRLTDGTTLLSLDQSGLVLHLHSGTADAGASGWRYGPEVTIAEGPGLFAAFNGGFKLSTDSGGFFAFGHSGARIRNGLGSIVTYTNGTTDVGDWGAEVPRPALAVASVRQNLPLLVDHGRAATNVGCLNCWGATLGGVVDPARSALGITAGGRLIWAGGEHMTTIRLADVLIASHAVRAVELDINPEWVAGYVYGHRGGHGPLAPVSLVAGQAGIPGAYLTPWSRDFFTVVTR